MDIGEDDLVLGTEDPLLEVLLAELTPVSLDSWSEILGTSENAGADWTRCILSSNSMKTELGRYSTALVSSSFSPRGGKDRQISRERSAKCVGVQCGRDRGHQVDGSLWGLVACEDL